MQLHQKQQDIVRSKKRFKVARAGRKGGKTALEVENICYKATVSAKKLNLTKTSFNTGRKVLYIAPTQAQARNIIWGALKARLHNIGTPNEQMLQMKVPNEDGQVTTIYVGGWENRENYRGLADVIHITFDETDTLRDFFISWLEIFRPMFLDTGGTADFIGTPKKENPNMRRLEKEAEIKPQDWDCFHFTSENNPFLSRTELDAMKQEYKNDYESYKQEILAEYVENQGALFKYDALVDVFSNTVTKDGNKYLIIDVADDGTDKTVFSFWDGLEEYRRESFERLNTESIIMKTREYASVERIPYSHIAVDAIGVGSSVASSSLLDGIIGYKSSFAPIKTDIDIVRLPNQSYTANSKVLTSDYKNLRSQCVFILSEHVNNHKIASKVTGVQKEYVIEELSQYQDASTGDGKRMATKKEDVKVALGRSPDDSDCFIAGTKIDTPNGKVNIETIKKGDSVSTPFGYTKVVKVIKKKTNKLYTIDNKLTGTGNHKIYSGSVFTTLDKYNMRVYNYYINSNYNKFIWKILSLLSTKIKNIGFRGLVDTSITVHTKMELDNQESLCIEKSGKIQTKRKSLKDLIYTILTMIVLITTRVIYLVLNLIFTTPNILNYIGKIIFNSIKIIWTKLESKLLFGMVQKKAKSGILKTQKNHGIKESQRKEYVKIVQENMNLLVEMVSVLIRVFRSIIIELKNIMKIENVSFVDYLLVSGSLNKPKLVQEVVQQKVDGIDVYTLSLENHHVYIANDVLVANCFIMRMYFVIRGKMSTEDSPGVQLARSRQVEQFNRNQNNHAQRSSK